MSRQTKGSGALRKPLVLPHRSRHQTSLLVPRTKGRSARAGRLAGNPQLRRTKSRRRPSGADQRSFDRARESGCRPQSSFAEDRRGDVRHSGQCRAELPHRKHAAPKRRTPRAVAAATPAGSPSVDNGASANANSDAQQSPIASRWPEVGRECTRCRRQRRRTSRQPAPTRRRAPPADPAAAARSRPRGRYPGCRRGSDPCGKRSGSTLMLLVVIFGALALRV